MYVEGVREKRKRAKGNEGKRTVKRGACPFPRVCIIDKLSSGLKGSSTRETRDILEIFAESSLVKCAAAQFSRVKKFPLASRLARTTFKIDDVDNPGKSAAKRYALLIVS